MFDIYTEKLGHMQSIQYKIWAVRGEKPFEHLDSTKHDVFIISNSLHFTYLESHQILKKMEMNCQWMEKKQLLIITMFLG